MVEQNTHPPTVIYFSHFQQDVLLRKKKIIEKSTSVLHLSSEECVFILFLSQKWIIIHICKRNIKLLLEFARSYFILFTSLLCRVIH